MLRACSFRHGVPAVPTLRSTLRAGTTGEHVATSSNERGCAGVVALYIGDCTRLLHAQTVHLLRRLPMLRTVCLESVVGGLIGPSPPVLGAGADDGGRVSDATLGRLVELCPHVTAVAVRWGRLQAEPGYDEVSGRQCWS